MSPQTFHLFTPDPYPKAAERSGYLMDKAAFDPTPRTTVRRVPGRASYDRDVIYRILDEGLVCQVGFVVEEQPYVIPMSYARRGNELILHGSGESRLLKSLGEGSPTCVTVTLLDGLVLARSALHHSVNYRSVVVLGVAQPIHDPEEKRDALRCLVEHAVPGRAKDARPPSEEEVAATTVLKIPIKEASAKTRSGPPSDAEADMHLPVWAGVLPFRTVAIEPEPDATMMPGIDVPRYVTDYRRPGGSK
jgi:nitroimidazol reductase NimA-like FMN-containing flavoprotein (pyridoxamine 5'-phosphate oxidase superfamily)